MQTRDTIGDKYLPKGELRGFFLTQISLNGLMKSQGEAELNFYCEGKTEPEED